MPSIISWQKGEFYSRTPIGQLCYISALGLSVGVIGCLRALFFSCRRVQASLAYCRDASGDVTETSSKMLICPEQSRSATRSFKASPNCTRMLHCDTTGSHSSCPACRTTTMQAANVTTAASSLSVPPKLGRLFTIGLPTTKLLSLWIKK